MCSILELYCLVLLFSIRVFDVSVACFVLERLLNVRHFTSFWIIQPHQLTFELKDKVSLKLGI